MSDLDKALDEELDFLFNKTFTKFANDNMKKGVIIEITKLITDREVAARVDENESLLSVAEHEIELPDHCDMHDKYSSYCHACKKRKWYGEISKDWKRIIEIRIAELQQHKEEVQDG